MGRIGIAFVIILIIPESSYSDDDVFAFQIEPRCLMKRGPIVVDVSLTYKGEGSVSLLCSPINSAICLESRTPKLPSPVDIVSINGTPRDVEVILTKGQSRRRTFFLHHIGSEHPDEFELLAWMGFQYQERNGDKPIGPLLKPDLKRQSKFRLSDPSEQELRALRDALVNDITSSPCFPDYTEWCRVKSWLYNTQRDEFCPVAIAMIEHACEEFMLTFSVDYLKTCTKPSETVNHLIIKELVKSPLLCANVFVFWNNSKMPPPSPAQIEELLRSENTWVRVLALAAFPNQVDKAKKESIIRNLLQVMSPTPTADCLELVRLLDDPRFATRESATRTLIGSGQKYEAMLVSVGKNAKSIEVESRLDRILREIINNNPSSEGIRTLNALKLMNTPGADDVLRLIADGPDGLRTTEMAKGILEKKRANAVGSAKKK